MSRFVQISDFEKGELQISKTCYSEGTLQVYIDEIEEKVLIELLGLDLYNIFILDWDTANPNANEFSEQRFKDLYEKFFYEHEDCFLIQSKGIKYLIMYFVYFEYLKFQSVQNRTTGAKATEEENSKSLGFSEIGLFEKYNLGVESHIAIQFYMCEKDEIYPEFKGVIKHYLSWM